MQLIDVKSGTKREKGGDENNFESRELFFLISPDCSLCHIIAIAKSKDKHDVI